MQIEYQGGIYWGCIHYGKDLEGYLGFSRASIWKLHCLDQLFLFWSRFRYKEKKGRTWFFIKLWISHFLSLLKIYFFNESGLIIFSKINYRKKSIYFYLFGLIVLVFQKKLIKLIICFQNLMLFELFIILFDLVFN